ncbi:MAG: response regulator [Candidatus Riflebacteria bacterium]
MSNENRFNVLIADDEPRFCEILEDLLSGQDVNIYSVHTPENAIDAVLNYDIHLALLDKRFPTDLDGIATLKRLKQIKPDTEVIILTAYPDAESNLDAISLGAHSYLPKTLDYERMLSALKKIFDLVKSKRRNSCLISELEERNHWLESISGTIKSWNEKLVRRLKTVDKSDLFKEEEDPENFLPHDNVELFAFALVHELNNHLQIIDLVLSEFADESGANLEGALLELQEAVNQLSSIAESYSQIIAGQESKEYNSVDIEILLHYVFKAAWRLASARGVMIERQTDLERKKIKCQPRLLSDALLNILKNAVEAASAFGKETVAKVSLKAYYSDSDLVIEIANSGAPIDENVFKKMFIGMTQKSGHLGVGLCLSKHAIEKHDGRLEVKRAGDWNVFQISLPN